MTIEEIERTLQTVAENQAQFSSDVAKLTNAQIGYESRQERLDDAFMQIAESHRMLVELIRIQKERLDGHDAALRATDEKLNALIDAQIGLEARQSKLEESYQLLVRLAKIQEERIDGQDEAHLHTDARLDALIDAQVQLTQRVDTLTGDIAALNGRFKGTGASLDRIGEYIEAHSQHLTRIDERLDQVASLQVENAEQIKALIAAQLAVDQKPKARSAKKAKKPAKKGAK